MSKQRKTALTVFYAWFAGSSVFCFLLDLFMSVVTPEHTDPMNIDISFLNQISYLSVWLTFTIATWATLNLIGLYVKGMPKWVSSKNNRTFIASMTLVMLIVYLGTMIGGALMLGGGVYGFDNWYKILKSSIEHFFNPVVLFIVYFVFADAEVNEKKYARGDAWYVLIFTSAYILIMIIRDACLRNRYLNPDFDPSNVNNNGLWNPFPYAEVDPFTAPAYLWIPALIAMEFVPYGVECLFNFLSNKSYLSMKKRYPKF